MKNSVRSSESRPSDRSLTRRQALALFAGATVLLGALGCGGSDDGDAGGLSVRLTPIQSAVSPGGSTNLTVSTVGASEPGFTFRWTLSGGAGSLRETALPTNAGRDFVTTTTGVTLLAAASDAANTSYTVTVEAISKESGRSGGTATSQVTVSDDGSVGLAASSRLYEENGPGNQVEIGVVVGFAAPPAGATRYILRGNGPAGNPYFPSGEAAVPFSNPNFVSAFGTIVPRTVKISTATGLAANADMLRANYENVFNGWTWQVIAYTD